MEDDRGNLFKAGFTVLDDLPEYEKQPLARRVYTSAYDRAAGNPEGDSGSSKTGSPEAVPVSSNTAGLKSSRPRPPK